MTKPREPLAELEQLRRWLKIIALHGCPGELGISECSPFRSNCRNGGGNEDECRDCWTAALTQAETPNEKVVGRTITRDEALRISRQTIDDAEREREALAQAEGGE